MPKPAGSAGRTAPAARWAAASASSRAAPPRPIRGRPSSAGGPSSVRIAASSGATRGSSAPPGVGSTSRSGQRVVVEPGRGERLLQAGHRRLHARVVDRDHERRLVVGPEAGGEQRRQRGPRDQLVAVREHGEGARLQQRLGRRHGAPYAPRPSGPPAMPSGGTVMRSGSAVIVPIRRAPGWWRASSATRVGLVGLRHDDDEAAAHVEDLPHLRLGDVAELAHEVEDGRRRQRVGDLVADVGVEAQQVQQAAAGDVREPAHAAPERSSSSTART